jgi:hypothetical protein
MISYKNFLFVETYGLENHMSTMYEELTQQFDQRAEIKNYFEDQGFGLIIDSDKGVYKNYEYKEYNFLDTRLVFPPEALSYRCTICWRFNVKENPEFFWTSNFPQLELEKYVNNADQGLKN